MNGQLITDMLSKALIQLSHCEKNENKYTKHSHWNLQQKTNINVTLIQSKLLLLHALSSLFFQDNLGKPAPEKQNHSGKINLDLLKQETVSGSGIRMAICKSAPRHRQITTPAPHHSVFTDWMPFLLPNQHHQRTEGKSCVL